jgi:hypothetical protein
MAKASAIQSLRSGAVQVAAIPKSPLQWRQQILQTLWRAEHDVEQCMPN